MEEYRAWIILACVGAFFALCIGVGLWAMRKTNSAHDFFSFLLKLFFLFSLGETTMMHILGNGECTEVEDKFARGTKFEIDDQA